MVSYLLLYIQIMLDIVDGTLLLTGKDTSYLETQVE